MTTRATAVRQSLHLRIQPSPYTPAKALPVADDMPSTNTTSSRPESDDNLDAGDASDSVMFSVLCMYDFEPEEAGLISFKKNEILDIIKRDDTGWWAAVKQDGPDAPMVGWIPQAYVSPLSQEMDEKLRKMEEQFRVPEYEAEMLYNSIPVATSLVFEDSPSSSPTMDDDYSSYKASSINSSSTFYSTSSDMRHLSGKRDENVNPYSSTSNGSPRSRPNPPPSPTSPVPRPPSRSASFKRAWKPTPALPDDNKTRSGSSLTQNRSIRRQPMQVSESYLSRLANRLESTKSREVTKISSPTLTGSFESLYKRTGDDRMQRRKPSEDSSLYHHSSHSSYGSRPSYFQSGQIYKLDEDDKGHVRSGTLPALIERLTSETPSDLMKLAESRTFTNVFLMTFRTFTTPNELFDALIERFYMNPPDNLPEGSRTEWRTYFRLPLRRRVLEVFGAWLEEHRLLEEEPYIAQRLTEFLTSVSDHLLTDIADAMLKTLERLTFTIPSKPSTVLSPKKARKSKAHKNDLLRLDPADVAEQLTLLEFGLYVKITPQECLAYAKTQSGIPVAGLQEFCSTHDKLGSWVKTSILNNDALSKRSDTVDFWIKVAEKCRMLNNFSSMSAIIVSLSSTVLTRLHMTWAHVGRKSVLDGLLRHNEPSGGFSGYRTLLQQTEGPCVPFITMYLTDIIHANEHTKLDEGVISFYQRARWYEIITNLLKFQSRPYRIAPSDSTTIFIEAHLREALRDQNWFWQRSQEVQHSELAHADIRKGLEAAGF